MSGSPKPFFVLSCARSGSTSLAHILDTATNGHCAVEPMPNLNRESRDMREGRIADPAALLEDTVVKRVLAARQNPGVYGEKNVTYGPFLELLHQRLACRLVFMHRDGRDVVRSLMDWHERMFGTIYRECADSGKLSQRAVQEAANLLMRDDSSDYTRPRPLPHEPLFDAWEHLSREEMCAYYWAQANTAYRETLAGIPQSDWFELDYSRATARDIVALGDFLELEGLEEAAVADMLGDRINSIRDRIGEADRYPTWRHWDSGARDRFAAIAGDAMRLLGYWSSPAVDWRPTDYGRWWKEHDGGLEWYEWMHGSRAAMHRDLVAWVRSSEHDASIRSIADFGAGLGVGYCDAFADRRYVGLDLCRRNTDWCSANRTNERHDFRCIDFVAEPLGERFDLVFSSGTIDNTYDVDACLRAMVAASRGWIHATCYRGWFPELDEHRYTYNPAHQCFYNDISPRRVRQTLEAAGCEDVRIDPIRTGNDAIPYETRIVARRSRS